MSVFHRRKIPKLTSKMQISFVNEAAEQQKTDAHFCQNWPECLKVILKNTLFLYTLFCPMLIQLAVFQLIKGVESASILPEFGWLGEEPGQIGEQHHRLKQCWYPNFHPKIRDFLI
jgi:hypothetical protein